MLEPVNDTVTDELLALAQEYDVPVVLMNRRATAEQLATFPKLYSILKADDSEEAELERLADTIADYWEKNRDDLDNWLHDDKLSIAAVTEYGYEESGKWTKLQSLLEERGCTAKLTKDVVTEYLNYNLEYSLDAIYYSGAELLLFSDSADAERQMFIIMTPQSIPKVTARGEWLWRRMKRHITCIRMGKCFCGGQRRLYDGSGRGTDGKAVAGEPASARFQQLGFSDRWRKDFPLQPSGAAECNRNSGTRGAGYQFQPHSGGRNFLMGKSSKIDRI